MSSKEILILGSLHYDIFLQSKNLPRIGETVKAKKWYPKLGGKGGNQAIAAAAYPVSIKLVSAVGKDDFGNYILKNLKDKSIDTTYIQSLSQHSSGMSVAISNHEGDYGATIVSGANLHIDHLILDDPTIWEKTKLLMIQNEIDHKLNVLAANKAKKKGVKVFYNAAPAKKINSDLQANIDILLINKIEAEEITNNKISSLDDAFIACRLLVKSFPLVIISIGEKGIVMCEQEKKPIHFEALKVNVRSTHGAGDTFAGTFCAALVSGKEIDEAIKIAIKKAAEFISI